MFAKRALPPKRHTDDMSPSQLTDAGEDSGSLDSDVTNPRRPDHEPRTGVESRKRNASWRAPATLVGFLGILIAFLVFLFGNNVTSRFGKTEASSDGRDNDPSSLQPANGESRFHATYSFKKAPFVHPKIVGDLVGSLSDAGDQVVAVNLLDSQDSNRYFGAIVQQWVFDTIIRFNSNEHQAIEDTRPPAGVPLMEHV